MLPVEQPFKTYTGLDGKPLDNGFVYFGRPNENPITAPVTVFWDAAGTIPAAQPLRTVNGYIMRGGTPANVFFDGAYSELVQNKSGTQVFYARTSDEFSTAAAVRRLTASGGSSLIGFAQSGAGEVPRTVQAKLRETVSVTDFGAKGDGTADDTKTIQAALDAVSAAGGGTVWAPPGRYRLTARVTVPSFVLLKGMDWLPDPSNGSQVFHTTLVIDWGAGLDEHAVELSHSAGFEGFTFFYPGQVAKTASTPVAFGFSLSTPVPVNVYDNIHIRNVTLYNSYKGIRLNNGGRWRVDSIQGDPLAMGFTADQCLDVCYLNGVHFWNFYTQSDVLEDWVAANGTAFELRRVDQLFCSKTFSWNRNIAYYFRDNLWGDFSELCCDKANFPLIVEQSSEVRVNNFKLIGNTSARPAIWGRFVKKSASFSNGRISEAAGGVGAQIDDGRRYAFDNVEFDSGHTALINLSPTTEVRISDTCRWTVPPFGAYKTWVDSALLPMPDYPVALPAVELSGAASLISGGVKLDLGAPGFAQAAWDTTDISQRNSLYVLEFDYEMVGTITTFYFKFRVANDAGGDVQVSFEPLAPFRLNGGSVPLRVRIPFFINRGRFRQLMTLYAEPTIPTPGTAIRITNITLSEQADNATTDAQVANMIYTRYNLDAFGSGQTLYAKGRNRIVLAQPEPGNNRPTEVPTSGAWKAGDEVRVFSPVAGGSTGYVCVEGGTPGTWKPFGKIDV